MSETTVTQSKIIGFSNARSQRNVTRGAKKLFVRLFHPHTHDLLLDDYVNNQDQLDDILTQILESEDLMEFLPSRKSYTTIIKEKYNPLERLCDGFQYLVLEIETKPK